ncbi:2Fe-2S iron-sulfur cluster-binding protein [Halomicrococcus sp. NG-SE-24]|uniref:2Fe-2S iron-sulfur cluster-binding protein n=1 Tax=Halomicrococcus sp. NG-SE-24 TaxID=3436928 RepID=UPI003D96AF8E
MTTHTVTVELDGETRDIEVADDEYILDAGLETGLDLPYSCRSGNCTSCTGELLEGEVDQSDGTALDRDERTDGYVLLCSAYPRADCRLRAGDEIQEELLGLDLP